MKCLFNVKSLKIDKNGKFIVQLTAEERNQIKKTREEFKNIEVIPDIKDEFEKIIPVIGLVHYAYSLVRDYLHGEAKGELDNAINAISKAYLIHPLPIYLYDLGRFFEYKGNYDAAKQSYIDYIDAEENYKPALLDEMLIRTHDVTFTMSDAKERIKLLSRGNDEE